MRVTILVMAGLGFVMAGCATPPQTASARNETGIRAMVTQHAEAEKVPVALAHAIIRSESRYRPHVTGRAGEIGLGQIKCASARGLGYSGTCRALYDPATNLTWSMRYLRAALDRGGEGCAGVSLYNLGRFASPICTSYGKRILAGEGNE